MDKGKDSPWKASIIYRQCLKITHRNYNKPILLKIKY